jgi:alkylhydroperoxidase/carboxymuconolactone decarboxylase family protein YurZ
MSDDTDKSVDGMMAERTYSYPGFADFLDMDHDLAEAYDAFVKCSLQRDTEGMSRATWELVATALLAAGGHPGPYRNHIEDACRHGATEEEILGAIHVAAVVEGATSVVVGAQAYEEAGHPEEG